MNIHTFNIDWCKFMGNTMIWHKLSIKCWAEIKRGREWMEQASVERLLRTDMWGRGHSRRELRLPGQASGTSRRWWGSPWNPLAWATCSFCPAWRSSGAATAAETRRSGAPLRPSMRPAWPAQTPGPNSRRALRRASGKAQPFFRVERALHPFSSLQVLR